MTRSPLPSKLDQQGFLLIEGLIAVLIFAFGILGIVAMGAKAISAQSDAQYRTEAANFAEEIANTISLNTDTSATSPITLNAQLTPYAHNEGTSPGNCPFPTAASSKNEVTAWVNRMSSPTTGLPGANESTQQIAISYGTNHAILTVTVCWKAPADQVYRKHVLSTYISRQT